MACVPRSLVFLTATSTLACLACAVLAACGAKPTGPVVGVSDRPSGGGTSAPSTRDGGVIDGAAALPIDYRTKFTKLNKTRMVSNGHAAGRWDVDIYANEPARSALAERARNVPVGAVIVEEHYEKSATANGGGSGPVMVMEKRAKGYSPDHGDWRWTVVGAAGQLVRDGVVESCVGCHDDAPMDGMFPLSE